MQLEKTVSYNLFWQYCLEESGKYKKIYVIHAYFKRNISPTYSFVLTGQIFVPYDCDAQIQPWGFWNSMPFLIEVVSYYQTESVSTMKQSTQSGKIIEISGWKSENWKEYLRFIALLFGQKYLHIRHRFVHIVNHSRLLPIVAIIIYMLSPQPFIEKPMRKIKHFSWMKSSPFSLTQIGLAKIELPLALYSSTLCLLAQRHFILDLWFAQ